ncbi:hypothetical protein IWW51_000272 [Coemansia sp. RSA 2702]|nr:hypothetical protein IWW51_000272 [Coemansia sp. RSA 2702]
MPPPSPLITAEIMRRQQQQQQQQQSGYGERHTPSLPTAARGRSRRGTATSASPHHHPYRAPQPISRMFSPAFPAKDSDDFLLDSLPASQAAIIASLHNTPVMQFSGDASAAPAISAELSGLHLPDTMVEQQPEPRSRTLHQLSMSQGASQGAGAHDQAMLSASLAQQMTAWLEQTSAPLQAPATSSSVMATPAMLMNLPPSAHHLPHSSTGEIAATPPVSQPARSQLASVTQSAPMVEFIHPPAPPPLQIGPASAAEASKRGRRKSVTAPTDLLPADKLGSDKLGSDKLGGPRARRGEASRARRRSRATQLLSPRTTPLVPSILKDTPPALAPLTPAIAPTPGTTTPQQRARSIVAATSTTNIVGLEADVVTRLATKSNYQNIMEGNSEALGLTYRTEFKSGLERRRTNHKNAEQKRRDSLKLCFQDLRVRLPDVDPKLVSKIYLLNHANAYIDALQLANCRLVEALERRGVDAGELVAQAMAEAAATSGAADEPCPSDEAEMDMDA